MGFHSWECKGCGKSLLCDMATTETSAWMSRVVAMFKNGSVHIGEYGGYGDIDGASVWEMGDPDCWHHACWVKAGKPEYESPSNPAQDQGWFFNSADYEIEEPK